MFDQRAVRRSLSILPLAYALAETSAVNKVLDFGGGVGFLARMLRDFGVDAWSYDKYLNGKLNPGFHLRDLGKLEDSFDFVIAIEVLVHLTDIEEFKLFIKSQECKIILVSTEMNDRKPITWDYICNRHSQHISIFSRKSINNLAESLGMKVLIRNNYQIFYSHDISLDDLIVGSFTDLMRRYQEVGYKFAECDNRAISASFGAPTIIEG